MGRRGVRTSQTRFSIGAAAAEALAVLSIGGLADAVCRHGGADPHPFEAMAIAAALFVGLGALRDDYAVRTCLDGAGHTGRLAATWLLAVGLALSIEATRPGRRGVPDVVTCAVAVAVLLAMVGIRTLAIRRARARARAGELVARRIVLVGTEARVRRLAERTDDWRPGDRIVGALVLRGTGETLDEDLALAAAAARTLSPDDVILLVPRDDAGVVARCIGTFRRLPAAVHLETSLEPPGDRPAPRGFGAVSTTQVERRALSPRQNAAKRALDIGLSAAALLLLAPLLLAVAVAIRLDSRGPVLFRQRRYGFNQEPFRILKFRSMTTLEDGLDVMQVTTDDARVTRLGRLLRRTGIDELPQLLNVAMGDMSLVGPRPHALSEDRMFEPTIALYARRYNVRPGITGWAQVNGWRGEIDTEEKIRRRIEFDLHYVDHWSFGFDMTILAKTITSPRTFDNAK